LCFLSCGYCQSVGRSSPHKVTYLSRGNTAMNAVSAIALQSHAPVGIVIGEQQNRLCEAPVNIDIRDMPARNALAEVGAASGYSLRDANGVLLLEAVS
ncbi:MAG: hypothetical protein ACRD22_20655, partial [Terriglobia bacterium]